jgi:deazaflavin-dependent oxidoreductase (nitroreductase family)
MATRAQHAAGLGVLGQEPFCYVTTAGRVTGRPHTIEIWFAICGHTLYMLSGGGDRSDWVKNLIRTPETTVRIGTTEFSGQARVAKDEAEDTLARRLLLEKYEPTYSGDLSDWGRTALPIAVDLDVK